MSLVRAIDNAIRTIAWALGERALLSGGRGIVIIVDNLEHLLEGVIVPGSTYVAIVRRTVRVRVTMSCPPLAQLVVSESVEVAS